MHDEWEVVLINSTSYKLSMAGEHEKSYRREVIEDLISFFGIKADQTCWAGNQLYPSPKSGF